MDYSAFSYDEETETLGYSRKFDSLPDFHLRNPLHRIYSLDENNPNMPWRNKNSVKLLKSINNNLIEGNQIELYQDILHHANQAQTSNIENCLKDVKYRINLEKRLNFPLPIDLITSGLVLLEKGFPIQLFDRMEEATKILTIMNCLSSKRSLPSAAEEYKRGLVVLQNQKYEILITARYLGVVPLVIRNNPNVDNPLIKVYDSDWVRMTCDIYTERFLLAVASTVGHHISNLLYPEHQLITKIEAWGDHVLKVFGNNGFALIKNYEALCVGFLQSKGTPGITCPRRFLDNTIRDLLSADYRYKYFVDLLLDCLNETTSPHQITQLYGLHRIWGHPIIDSLKGIAKLKLIATKKIAHEGKASLEAGRTFKRIFASNYKKKHKFYPSIKDDCSSELADDLRANRNSPSMNDKYSNSDWDTIRFDTAFQIPETFNLSMVIADKAISPTKSELIHLIKSKNRIMTPELRRGVLRWINDQSVNPKEFLNDINNGLFPEDHMIMGQTPKERELNTTPRMFTLMSHLLRIYVVLTEQMLSDYILDFFPQVTMTNSLLELTKKFYGTTKKQAPGFEAKSKTQKWTSKTVCISLDFEKWNGHMRKESTFEVFASLGDIFGMPNLYNATYDIFEQCFIYLADGSYIPEISEDGQLVTDEVHSYTGHKGGMEGLRQKGWTIFTVCCLIHICERHNCTFEIMGMGDNQVIQLTLYSYKVNALGILSQAGLTDMQITLNRIFTEMTTYFSKLGLPLKPLETWLSEDLYLYGKYPVWRGVPLNMDLKKIMRMFHNSNDDIMTLENGLGTVYGNAASATQMSCFTSVAYAVGIFMSSYCVDSYLKFHPLLGEKLTNYLSSDASWKLVLPGEKPRIFKLNQHNVSERDLRLLIQIIPRSLGGYNSLNFFEIIMRGFPDNLTRDLTYLYQLTLGYEEDSVTSKIKNWMIPIYMPYRNFRMLIEDVSSVNLMSPRSPVAGVRQTVEKFITNTDIIKNQEFKQIFKGKITNQATLLSEALCQNKTLHIRLLHDIYEATIIGYVNSILSKVTKASTIQRLAISKSNRDTMSIVIEDEINFFKFFVWRSSVRNAGTILKCPTSMAKYLRLTSWGKNIIGVTTPFPMAYLSPTLCNTQKSCMCKDGYISVHLPESQLTNNQWLESIGSSPPYLGSMTKEKVVTGAGSKIYSAEPLVNRPLKLLRTINWFVPKTSHTATLIRKLVSAVCDVNPAEFEGVSEGTAGAEIHRYRDTSLKHGALASSNYLFSTRYHISTDNFTKYSKGGNNYDIHFQGCICSIVEWTNTQIIRGIHDGSTIDKFYHFNQTCYECVSLLDDGFTDMINNTAESFIPSNPSNPYLYVTSEKLTKSTIFNPYYLAKVKTLTSKDYSSFSQRKIRGLLHDAVSDLITLAIINQSTSTDDFLENIDLTNSYERTMYLKLNPKVVYQKTIRKILYCSEMEVLAHSKGITELARRRKLKAIQTVSRASPTAFLGLAYFYLWNESKRKMSFSPFIVHPNTIPITVGSSCSASKQTLLALLSVESNNVSREDHILILETKNKMMIQKMVIFDMVKIKTQECIYCKTEISITTLEDMMKKPIIFTCQNQHSLNSLICRSIYKSNISIERLRKDCKLEDSYHEGNRLQKEEKDKNKEYYGVTLEDCGEELIILYKSSWYKQKLIKFTNTPKTGLYYQYLSSMNEISYAGLYRRCPLPTSTKYKYTEILHKHHKALGDSTFVIGDGLGETSKMISQIKTVRKIVCTTILEPEKAAPHTYSHCVEDEQSEFGCTIEKTHMINNHNDILHPSWESDWLPMVQECQSIVSDVEIMDNDKNAVRQTMISKLLNLKDWRFAIIKDYLYNRFEINERLALILPKTRYPIELITTKFRTHNAPECWWVIRNSCCEYQTLMSYDIDNVADQFDSIIMELRTDQKFENQRTMQNILRVIETPEMLKSMHSRVISFLTMPNLGTFLPSQGSYTEIFLALMRYKKPQITQLERFSREKRLYDSDYYNLREIIFAVAVSSLVNIEDRVSMLRNSHLWILEWNTTGVVELRRLGIDEEEWSEPDIKVLDMIPYINSLLFKEKLTFEEITTPIQFKYQPSSREKVCFHISKSTSRKYKT